MEKKACRSVSTCSSAHTCQHCIIVGLRSTHAPTYFPLLLSPTSRSWLLRIVLGISVMAVCVRSSFAALSCIGRTFGWRCSHRGFPLASPYRNGYRLAKEPQRGSAAGTSGPASCDNRDESFVVSPSYTFDLPPISLEVEELSLSTSLDPFHSVVTAASFYGAEGSISVSVAVTTQVLVVGFFITTLGVFGGLYLLSYFARMQKEKVSDSEGSPFMLEQGQHLPAFSRFLICEENLANQRNFTVVGDETKSVAETFEAGGVSSWYGFSTIGYSMGETDDDDDIRVREMAPEVTASADELVSCEGRAVRKLPPENGNKTAIPSVPAENLREEEGLRPEPSDIGRFPRTSARNVVSVVPRKPLSRAGAPLSMTPALTTSTISTRTAYDPVLPNSQVRTVRKKNFNPPQLTEEEYERNLRMIKRQHMEDMDLIRRHKDATRMERERRASTTVQELLGVAMRKNSTTPGGDSWLRFSSSSFRDAGEVGTVSHSEEERLWQRLFSLSAAKERHPASVSQVRSKKMNRTGFHRPQLRRPVDIRMGRDAPLTTSIGTDTEAMPSPGLIEDAHFDDGDGDGVSREEDDDEVTAVGGPSEGKIGTENELLLGDFHVVESKGNLDLANEYSTSNAGQHAGHGPKEIAQCWKHCWMHLWVSSLMCSWAEKRAQRVRTIVSGKGLKMRRSSKKPVESKLSSSETIAFFLRNRAVIVAAIGFVALCRIVHVWRTILIL